MNCTIKVPKIVFNVKPSLFLFFMKTVKLWFGYTMVTMPRQYRIDITLLLQ